MDYDDTDANSTIVITDEDCDGVVTAGDYDDSNPNVTDIINDNSRREWVVCFYLF